MFKIVLFLIVINVSFFSTVSKSKTVLEIISETPSLQNFEIHLKKTGLDEVLGKKLPWNWTIFAPSNKAFENASSLVKQEILEDEFFSKNIFMDHIMTGHKTSLDIKEEITVEITVSNKPIQLYKSKKLHVKDMVVVKENLIGNNGVIHIIDCIMYVQPSSEDDRVSEELSTEFPITSCCMHNEKEVRSFQDAARNNL